MEFLYTCAANTRNGCEQYCEQLGKLMALMQALVLPLAVTPVKAPTGNWITTIIYLMPKKGL